ncbi:S-layer homology domain-containing protein [Gracilibacillus caseinilyticus]|uniref:S-layer homology domain-containing protein n=1 Tax=Gracilibacillus caseinilyticus TaxID=2932256 RepID=A0ABY4F0T8_9BACI|nr:S-layer homology domain-containing protein [Gracilibacillus caseinilyticus]UOQ50287.1 S-layer homology domain-containing protein [Gracilibacillus caseinilyticus]
MKWKLALSLTAVLFMITPLHNEAATEDIMDIKEMITEVSMEEDIPPEILKAIAYNENAFQQFDENGEPYISDDGGIGVMQVTPEKTDVPVDINRLKTDTEYNIRMGAKILNAKWDLNYLPIINNHSKDVLENWYFAITAYNGLSKQNDPNLHPDSAYAEEIYSYISSRSLLEKDGDYFDFPTFEFNYEDNSSIMHFPVGVDYQTTKSTMTRQSHEIGDLVYIDGKDGGANRYDELYGTSTRVAANTTWTIESKPIEAEGSRNDPASNHYVYYKVSNGNVEGYIASSYLVPLLFNDITPGTDEAESIQQLVTKGIINGYTLDDGTKEFRPAKTLSRSQAAELLKRSLDLSIPNNVETILNNYNDVDANHYYAEAIAATYEAGILQGAPADNGRVFNDDEPLSRSQMASILVRAFNLEDTKENTGVNLDNVSGSHKESVKILAQHGLTTQLDDFRPAESVSRGQFATFLYRALQLGNN